MMKNYAKLGLLCGMGLWTLGLGVGGWRLNTIRWTLNAWRWWLFHYCLLPLRPFVPPPLLISLDAERWTLVAVYYCLFVPLRLCHFLF